MLMATTLENATTLNQCSPAGSTFIANAASPIDTFANFPPPTVFKTVAVDNNVAHF
jgi:hypothetical protein